MRDPCTPQTRRPDDEERRSRLHHGLFRHLLRVTPFLLSAAIAAAALLGSPGGAGIAGAARDTDAEPLVATVEVPGPSTGAPFLVLPWGDGPGEVGLADGAGMERRGPEAFAVAADGRTAVLDSVNGRLLVVAPPGAVLGAIPLELSSPRFVAVTSDVIHVLDVDDDRRLDSYSWHGDPVSARPLPALDGPVTALLLGPAGEPLAEVGHEITVSIPLVPASTTAGGGPAEDPSGWVTAAAASSAGPTQEPGRGRPVAGRAGGRAAAGLAADGRPRIEARDEGGRTARRWEIRLEGQRSVDHLVSLDADPAGRLILGMRLRETAGGRRGDPASVLLCRLEEGRPVLASGTDAAPGSDSAQGGFPTGPAGRATIHLVEQLYAYLGPPYVVGGDGRVYAPDADPAGYRLLVHAFPEVTR